MEVAHPLGPRHLQREAALFMDAKDELGGLAERHLLGQCQGDLVACLSQDEKPGVGRGRP